MTMIKCPKCGEEIEKDSKFCDNCGANIENALNNAEKSFIEENKVPLIIIGAAALLVILFLAISPSTIPNGPLFQLEGEPTQGVDVDGIFLKIPNEFVLDPTSIKFDPSGGTLSSSKAWSHETEHIGLMVIRTPSYPNIDYSQALGANGGVQKNMYGYDGYYVEDDSGYSFAFMKDNKICVIMVSSYYLFDKITVE